MSDAYLYDVATAYINNERHICVTNTEGDLWHMICSPQPIFYGDVRKETQFNGSARRVSCVDINGELHVCIVSFDQNIWHTIRHANGNWDPFIDVRQASGTNPEAHDQLRMRDVSCANINNELHVCMATGEGNIRHTIRHANHWDQLGDVKQQAGDPGDVISVSCTRVLERPINLYELHLCVSNYTGGLWHTVRHNTRGWQPFEDVKSKAHTHPRHDPGYISDVSCFKHSEDRLDVQVLNDDGDIWTIFWEFGGWDEFFILKSHEIVGKLISLSSSSRQSVSPVDAHFLDTTAFVVFIYKTGRENFYFMIYKDTLHQEDWSEYLTSHIEPRK